MALLWIGAESADRKMDETARVADPDPALPGSKLCGAPVLQFSTGGMPTAHTPNSQSSGPAKGGRNESHWNLGNRISGAIDWMGNLRSYGNQASQARSGGGGSVAQNPHNLIAAAAAYLARCLGDDDSFLAALFDSALLLGCAAVIYMLYLYLWSM